MIARATRPVAGVMPVVPSRYETPYVSQESSAVFDSERSAELQSVLTVAERNRPVAQRPHLAPPENSQAPLHPPPSGTQKTEAVPLPTSRVEKKETAAPVSTVTPEIIVTRSAPLKEQIPSNESGSDSDDFGFVSRRETAAEPYWSHGPATVHPRDESPRASRVAKSRDPEPAQTVEVHVSIGHIEVRQAAPVSTPKPKPAPPSHLGLEDYLKRRSEGAR
jgi:hypothetical protein